MTDDLRRRLHDALSQQYAIERELGAGGMATVFLARDLRHERQVALKVLNNDLSGAVGADRFIREVRLTARLQHPNIAALFDSGVLPARSPDDVAVPWYAMAYVSGESLRRRLEREKPLPVDEALRITGEVAAALQAAHREGVVHRDIKPENVMLSDGRAYVVDFGIAKAITATGGEHLTSTGLAVGTPVYMSPEQALADTVDERTDQYSLAAVLYEMLTGEPPFFGPSAQAVIARRLGESARSIRTVRPAVSPQLETAVLKALERSPADRYSDVASFAAAIAAASTARSQAITFRGAAVTAGVLVVATLAAWSVFGGNTTRPTPDPQIVALYQRGINGYDKRTPVGVAEAIQSFTAAIARDSNFAPAWVGLAKAYARAIERQFVFPGVAGDSLVGIAVAAVDRALALDSSSADAWAARAVVLRRVDPTDVGPATRSARRAVALDSASGPAWHVLAVSLAEAGDMRGAIAAWRECVHRAPAYTQGITFLALAHSWQRRPDSAAVWADSSVAVDPNYLFGRTTLAQIAVERGQLALAAASYDAARRLSTEVEVTNTLAGRALVEARAGRIGEARRRLREVDSLTATYSPLPLHTAVYVSQAHAALGDAKGAVALLSHFPVRDDLHFQLHLRCDVLFDPIAKDRAFRALLTRERGAC